MTMQAQQPRPKNFKSQPWILFDTIAAYSFLLGDTSSNGLAIGSQTPAVSAAGEIVFFSGGGRTSANYPWYTNMDINGQLAYGFEVWQVYVLIAIPIFPLVPSYSADAPGSAPTLLNVPPTVRLAECLVNFGVLDMELGQENQFKFPLTRFGAGGGLVVNATAVANVQNSDQQGANCLALPEPIEMPRTQNINVKIKTASQVAALIGTVAAPGVGAPLATQNYLVAASTTSALRLQPYAIQVGFKGRRIKNTQYGQIPDGQG